MSCTTATAGPSVNVFLSALPALAYVWTLPFLSVWGFAESCWNCNPHIGSSISNYIANPHATGGMAAAFFFPCMLMWEPIAEPMNSKISAWTLWLFQLSFGLFLVFTVTWAPWLHGTVVGIFCVCAFVHAANNTIRLLRIHNTRNLWAYHGLHAGYRSICFLKLCIVLLVIQAIAFAGIICLDVFGNTFPHSRLLTQDAPWLFWMLESIGLSALVLVTPMWIAASDTVSHREDRVYHCLSSDDNDID